MKPINVRVTLPYISSKDIISASEAAKLHQEAQAPPPPTPTPQYHYRVTATRFSSLRKQPTPLIDVFKSLWQAKERAMFHVLNTPDRPDEGEIMNITIVKELVTHD